MTFVVGRSSLLQIVPWCPETKTLEFNPMTPLVVLLVAMILAHQFTPLVRALAWRVGVVDAPDVDNPGKIHRSATPLGGGWAIYGATLLTAFFVVGATRELVVLGAVSTCIAALGFLDDVVVLDWRPRMLIQLMAAAVFIVVADVRIPLLEEAWWSVPLMLFWMVGVTNALNLMDNIDGAASGVAFLGAILLFIIAPGTSTGLAALALAGGCIGFLRYNSKPASIFLGDTGSLFLGFQLAALSLLQAQHLGSAPSSLLVLPLIVGVPIFDTALATFLRLRRGRPVYLPDGSNLTYRLFGIGLKDREVIVFEYVLAAFLGFCALATLRLDGILAYAPFAVATVCLLLIGDKMARVPYADEAPAVAEAIHETSSRTAA